MVEPSDAARPEAHVDVVSAEASDAAAEADVAAGERRLRPLEWLSEPADRQQDLQTWLDFRRTMIGSARERWRP